MQVLCGNRYSPRERIFDAVIDKVEVKTLGELSPREIEHDNPEIRRTDEMAHFLGQLYNREVVERRRRDRDPLHPDPDAARSRRRSSAKRPLLALRAADLRAEELVRAQRLRRTPRSRRRRSTRTAAPHALQRRSSSPPHCGHSSGTSASNCSNQRRAGAARAGRRRPSRRAPCAAPRAASRTPCP